MSYAWRAKGGCTHFNGDWRRIVFESAPPCCQATAVTHPPHIDRAVFIIPSLFLAMRNAEGNEDRLQRLSFTDHSHAMPSAGIGAIMCLLNLVHH